MTNQSTAVEALGVAVAARVPVLLWGAPGTGKTSVIRAMAAAADLPCETVIASIREPSDFAGLPIVSGSAVDFAPPRWATRLAQQGRGLLPTPDMLIAGRHAPTQAALSSGYGHAFLAIAAILALLVLAAPALPADLR